MEKRSGTTRCVFVFAHLVVKVALVEWGTMFKIFKSELKIFKRKKWHYFSERNKVKKHLVFMMKNSERREKFGMKTVPQKIYEIDFESMSYYFLKGISSNTQERRFYRKTKNKFVMPTYFSFLGLINIQKRGKEINFWGNKEMFIYLCKNSKNRDQPHIDGHTLCEIENFVLDDDNHIKLVDYGNRQIGPFLELNGENLYNNFKLPE